MKILGIETSCDECSASVVEYNLNDDQIPVLSLSTFSQIEMHQPFGGVVPEIASRDHLEKINVIIDQALTDSNLNFSELDAVAVTTRPGLIGPLLVGLSAAKALCYSFKKPLIPVHHLEGHISSLYLDQKIASQFEYPILVAVISGGHTNLYHIKTPPHQWNESILDQACIAKSLDDAAGEAFDKTAKALGFPYPGGMWIDQYATKGDATKFDFPRSYIKKNDLNFSFSGLKTSFMQKLSQFKDEDELKKNIPDLCASIQEAIVDTIYLKLKRALELYPSQAIAIVGGVAANSRLRDKLNALNLPLYLPRPQYCTDNAAMIGAIGAFRFSQNQFIPYPEYLKYNAKN